jgi:hypothetical protein
MSQGGLVAKHGESTVWCGLEGQSYNELVSLVYNLLLSRAGRRKKSHIIINRVEFFVLSNFFLFFPFPRNNTRFFLLLGMNQAQTLLIRDYNNCIETPSAYVSLTRL